MARVSVFALCTIVCLVFLSKFAVAEDAVGMPRTSGLVDELINKLSLTPDQATAAAGAVLGLAKSNLNPEDFEKLAAGFPEIENLLKAEPAAICSSPGDFFPALIGNHRNPTGLTALFKKSGISEDKAKKIVPEFLAFVKVKQGEDMMGILAEALQYC